jgi:hypothetical protein
MNWSEAVAAESEMLYRRLLTGTEETHEERQVDRSPGRELNPGLPEYEATGNTRYHVGSCMCALFNGLLLEASPK